MPFAYPRGTTTAAREKSGSAWNPRRSQPEHRPNPTRLCSPFEVCLVQLVQHFLFLFETPSFFMGLEKKSETGFKARFKMDKQYFQASVKFQIASVTMRARSPRRVRRAPPRCRAEAHTVPKPTCRKNPGYNCVDLRLPAKIFVCSLPIEFTIFIL